MLPLSLKTPKWLAVRLFYSWNRLKWLGLIPFILILQLPSKYFQVAHLAPPRHQSASAPPHSARVPGTSGDHREAPVWDQKLRLSQAWAKHQLSLKREISQARQPKWFFSPASWTSSGSIDQKLRRQGNIEGQRTPKAASHSYSQQIQCEFREYSHVSGLMFWWSNVLVEIRYQIYSIDTVYTIHEILGSHWNCKALYSAGVYATRLSIFQCGHLHPLPVVSKAAKTKAPEVPRAALKMAAARRVEGHPWHKWRKWSLKCLFSTCFFSEREKWWLWNCTMIFFRHLQMNSWILAETHRNSMRANHWVAHSMTLLARRGLPQSYETPPRGEADHQGLQAEAAPATALSTKWVIFPACAPSEQNPPPTSRTRTTLSKQ